MQSKDNNNAREKLIERAILPFNVKMKNHFEEIANEMSNCPHGNSYWLQEAVNVLINDKKSAQ